MSFAGDKLYNDYLRRNMGKFTTKVKVREIMPHLPCLTQSDKEEIEAKREQAGNYNAMQLLVDCLKRRENWSEEFISALRACEHNVLAQEIEEKYNSFLVQRNPKSPPSAATVVRAHVHPAPNPNPSLPIPESSDTSASASPAQPAPLAEPASQPSPPVVAAVDPAPAPQPSPPVVATVDPAPAPQPSPPVVAAVDPAPAPQPSPPVVAAVDPAPAPQPCPPVVAAVDPAPAPQPSPPVMAAVDPAPAPQPSPPVVAAADPAPAPQPSPPVMAAVDPAPAPQPSPPVMAAADPAPAPQLSPPLRVDPAPLPSPPCRAAVDPHLEVSPAGPHSPHQQPHKSVLPRVPTPLPPASPVTTEISPQRAPSPLSDQILTAPVESRQSPRIPSDQTDPSATTGPSPFLHQMKFPVQDTAPLSPAVLPPAQQPVEDADPTIQVQARDYEQAKAPQHLNQPVSEPRLAPCWAPVDGAHGPVFTLSDEYLSKPAPLMSTIPVASLSINLECLEISRSVSGLDPDSAARAPAVCTSVTSDPEVVVNSGPCQQNGVLEEDTPASPNEPEENSFESTCQSSLGDQDVRTNEVHVFEEPSLLNHEGQTQSMMGNAVNSFEHLKNNDSQSHLRLDDGAPESDDLHESVHRNAASIDDDSKSQILNGQATKEPISDPPVSDVTISVIAASSSDDSQNSELERELLEQETQRQAPQEEGTIPQQNPTKPKNQKNYYLLTAAAVGVSALFMAWRLKN